MLTFRFIFLSKNQETLSLKFLIDKNSVDVNSDSSLVIQ